MSEILKFATVVVYADDVPATIAFWTRDVVAAFQIAVEAGATALTPPRVLPWGYKECESASLSNDSDPFVS